MAMEVLTRTKNYIEFKDHVMFINCFITKINACVSFRKFNRLITGLLIFM
jgi:hypothetical protein